MSYTFWDFLELLGSLGIFIFGMKIMSEGLQNAAGNQLRKILGGMTSTRASGVFTGFGITCLVQSSSATTVMVVSFVNAGLLTLGESLGVIMGANIGTTLTAWIVSYFGFKVKIQVVAIMLTGIAFPFLFSKRTQLKYIAEFVLGFAILFIGLGFLKGAVPDVKSNPEMMAFLTSYTDMGFASIMLFILVGTLLTVVVQSSSASTTITLVMLHQGWIDFEIAAAMVLGENLGTTITANIAAAVANVTSKQAARFHSIFNILGIVWMLFVMGSFLQLVDYVNMNFIGSDYSVFSEDEAARESSTQMGLALFHSMFNILNVLLFIGFTPYLEKLVRKMQPSTEEDEEHHLTFISTGLMSTPELSLEQAKKETQLFADILRKMSGNMIALLYEKVKNYDKLTDKIKRREEITDRLEIELSNYLGSLAEGDINEATSKQIRSMLRMANDMESIGDIFYQQMINTQRLKKLKVEFSEEVKAELDAMFKIIDESIRQIQRNLVDPNLDHQRLLKSTYETEHTINDMRDKLQQAHYDRLEAGKYTIEAGIIYLDYINSLEKIGDHIVNVNEAIAGLK